jgi:hypothetical protein
VPKLVSDIKGKDRLGVFDNRVLRRMFGLKKCEGWRKLQYEDLCNLYFSSSIIRIIKSRRLRWGVQIAQNGGVVGN